MSALPSLQAEEQTQPWYDLAWLHGASAGTSHAGDDLESLTFTPAEFEAFCCAHALRSALRTNATHIPHTKEAWKIIGGDRVGGWIVGIDGEQLLVGGAGLRSLVNAQLIAAAPAMRDALRLLLDASMCAMTDETSATNESLLAWNTAYEALEQATGVAPQLPDDQTHE